MTNKSGARQHGGHEQKQRAPKSAIHKRNNKGKARAKRSLLKAKGLNC